MFDISKCPKDKDGNLLAQTRDGQPVTLIAAKGREPWPVVGYVGDCTSVNKWGLDGKFTEEMDRATDIINIPEPKRSGEVWIYGTEENGTVRCWVAYGEPGGNDLVFKHKHPWTEGEGLEGK